MSDKMMDYLSFIDSVRGKQTEGGNLHHIIPRSIHRLTPSTVAVNDPSNLVRLSYEDHLMAHYLLYLAFRDGPRVYAVKAALAYCLMVDVAYADDGLPEPVGEVLRAYVEAAKLGKSYSKPVAYMSTYKSTPIVLSRRAMCMRLYGSDDPLVLARLTAEIYTGTRRISKGLKPKRSSSQSVRGARLGKQYGMVVDATSDWFKQQYPKYWVQDA